MGDPVAYALAVLVGLATAYCLVRCLVPRWRLGHGVAVDAWHVAMGVAMVAMLLAPVGSLSATLQAGLFGIGALWCVCHVLALRGSGAHARLGVACAVMAAMLMPAVVAAPATAAEPQHHEHHHVPGMDVSAMDMSATSGHHAMAMPPAWLAIAMLLAVALVAIAAVRAAVAAPGRGGAVRLSLACEVLMAGAMGYMAAVVLLP